MTEIKDKLVTVESLNYAYNALLAPVSNQAILAANYSDKAGEYASAAEQFKAEAKASAESAQKSSVEAAEHAKKVKSAYTYAKDGGYTGTEAEFGKDLASVSTLSEEVAELLEQSALMQYFVDSVGEMTDTSKRYVLKSTGTVWEYTNVSTEVEVTVRDELDDTTYYDNTRLGSSATNFTDGLTTGATGYLVSPLIDLTKYQGKTIQIHLDGARYISEETESYIQHRAYGPDGNIAYVRGASNLLTSNGTFSAWKNATVVINNETSSTITVDIPILYGSQSLEIRYLRFGGKGTSADSNIYITYQDTQVVISGQWEDTGMQFGYFLGDVQSSTVVDDVSKMVDTERRYVLKSTGKFWEYRDNITTTQTVTERIVGTPDNSYEIGRLSSGAANGLAGYVVTPYIDIASHDSPFELTLNKNQFSADNDSNLRFSLYRSDKTHLQQALFNYDAVITYIDAGCCQYVDNSDGTITLKFSPPVMLNNSSTEIGLVRFTCHGSESDAQIYITHKKEVFGSAWVETDEYYSDHSIFGDNLYKLSELNNEGAAPETIKLLSKPVLDFYNAEAYPSDDYTKTHLGYITYPCRADIPVPYTVKWSHNENAMRTTVAVDEKVIGTVNNYSMRTYDATGFDNYPIYNLIPGKTYYYKVTHVLCDGSLVEAKAGSFKTSDESWRLIYIDGTQNVRDFGGWTGLGGKKVKYGKLFRGATLSDSSFPELLLTGKGRRALGELKIRAELNLGADDVETEISASCDYQKIFYSSYANVITNESVRTAFKTIFEKIVYWLSEPTPRNIYMHCQGGCDRTGSLSFLLLGLLGVSESDLAKDYELSCFSSIGFGRLRTTTEAVNTYDYVGMVAALKEAYSGSTITDKFVSFATDCGISVDTIASFRNLMLE